MTKNPNYPAVPSPFEDQFLDAIRVAAAQWKFDPARIADLEPGPDGRPVVIRSTAVESTLDLVFTFEAGKAAASTR